MAKSITNRSLATFGDLSGIVKNITTGQLIGGHKQVEAFKIAADVQIEKSKAKPNTQGTTAFGYVVADGNRFAYREVQWTPEKERQANLAANQWGAEWDQTALAAILNGLAGC